MPFLSEKNPVKGVVTGLLGRVAMVGVALAVMGPGPAAHASSAPYPDADQKAQIDRLIVFYSKRYNVPVSLARQVVRSESEYRPLARNGPYWGLMQIRYDTAQGMGYSGPAKGLLDAETNLAYGIAYLANSLKAAGGNTSRGHMLYRKGYYYEAKRRRVLDEMIMVRDFKPVAGQPALLAMVETPETGTLWSGDPTAAVFAAAPGLAPMPRPKPDEATAPAVASPVVVQASIAGSQPAPAVAAPVAKPAVAAAVTPAIAQPQVVYASVLPFARAPAFRAPAATAPALLAAATTEAPEMSPVADPSAPIPRPRPGLAIAVAAVEGQPALDEMQVAAAAANMPVPRPRPAAAIDGSIPVAIVAPVVVAQHIVPVPRARPLGVVAE